MKKTESTETTKATPEEKPGKALAKTSKKKGFTERQIWYMPKAFVLEKLSERKLVLETIAIISILIIGLIVWASITHIDETAITFGEVIPIGDVKIVQHLEGGIISKVYVKNAQHVKKGQPLIQIDPTLFTTELKQLQARRIALQIDAERLRAFSEEGKILTLDQFRKNIDDTGLDQKTIENMLKDDNRLLELQKKLQSDKVDALQAEIKQRKEEVVKLEEQQKLSTETIRLFNKELNMLEKLIKKGYISLRDHLQLNRSYVQAKDGLAQLNSQISQALSATRKVEYQLNEVRSQTNQDVAENLGTVTSELFQLNFAIQKIQDKVKRSLVVAQISGYIKGLKASTGTIIPEGGEILTIVPDNVRLQLEVKVGTTDVGYISIGDPAKIKILSYDFSRHGTITGKVTRISATTFVDEDGNPYYAGMVSLDKEYVGKEENKIIPGMTAEADIVTGRKTLLQYLLKPIHLTIKNSFSER